jgi:hypothetical protein
MLHPTAPFCPVSFEPATAESEQGSGCRTARPLLTGTWWRACGYRSYQGDFYDDRAEGYGTYTWTAGGCVGMSRLARQLPVCAAL